MTINSDEGYFFCTNCKSVFKNYDGKKECPMCKKEDKVEVFTINEESDFTRRRRQRK